MRFLALLMTTSTTVACSSRVATSTAEQVPPRAPPGSKDASAIQTSASVVPRLSPCVLHAGSASVKTRNERELDGTLNAIIEDARCYFNAECIARHGERTAGDGFVYLACVNGDCSCRIEQDTPPSPPIAFQFRATCTTDARAKQLLLDHCLKGMNVVPERP